MFNDDELRIIALVVAKADPMNLIQATQSIARKIEDHFRESAEAESGASNAEPVE